MTAKTASFRFFGALIDFLPVQKKEREIKYSFSGNPSVKDAIEAIGVPHVEVDIILVNNDAVDFTYKIQDTDNIEVYPQMKSSEFQETYSLSVKPDLPFKFVADVHLGKLARMLRMIGFDTVYENNISNSDILNFAETERRIVLTRDVFLLKNKRIKSGLGYWLRSEFPEVQLKEVILRLDLFNFIRPFVRCMDCNGIINSVPKEEIQHILEQNTKAFFNEFYQCSNCKKVYWKGSHYERMEEFINKLLNERD